MPWEDRLQQGAYTGPQSGVRLTFDFEDVARTVTKKGRAFDFPDANGTYVQELGNTSRRYPLRLFFSGGNYDLEADAFESALLERGVGKLEHPIYGTVNVVPFGDITRRDDLKTAANQAIIEVTFWATIDLVYPLAQVDLGAATLAAVERFRTAQAQDYNDALAPIGPTRAAVLKQKYNAFLNTTESALGAVADQQANVQRQFEDIVDDINRGIDVLISQPLTLAFQTSIMIQAPARALAAIQARLSAYGNLAQSLFAPTTADEPEAVPLGNDELRTRDLFVSSSVTGSVVSTVNNAYGTRREALEAAEDLLDQLADLSAWRDQAYIDSDEVDPGGAIQAVQDSVALAVAFLIESSFSLRQERSLVLDRARAVPELVAELYGAEDFDENIDFFIESNDLSGSEIKEIPKGRRVVYYV